MQESLKQLFEIEMKQFLKIEAYHISGLYLLASVPAQNYDRLVYLPNTKFYCILNERYQSYGLLNCRRLAFAYISLTYEHYSSCRLCKSLRYVVLCLIMVFSILRSKSALLQVAEETVKEETAQILTCISEVKPAKSAFGKVIKCWGQGL